MTLRPEDLCAVKVRANLFTALYRKAEDPVLGVPFGERLRHYAVEVFGHTGTRGLAMCARAFALYAFRSSRAVRVEKAATAPLMWSATRKVFFFREEDLR